MIIILKILLYISFTILCCYIAYKVTIKNDINSELTYYLQLAYEPEVGFIYELYSPNLNKIFYLFKNEPFQDKVLKSYVYSFIENNDLYYNIDLSEDEKNVASQMSATINNRLRHAIIKEFKNEYKNMDYNPEINFLTQPGKNPEVLYYPFDKSYVRHQDYIEYVRPTF